MTPLQVLQALDIYEGVLKAAGAQPARCPSSVKGPSPEQHKDHLLWMCIEARNLLEAREAKAMRWLGFIQDGLWVRGFFSVDDLKSHNR